MTPSHADKDDYCAWRAAVARAKPDLKAAAVASLKPGERVAGTGQHVAGADGELWHAVAVNGKDAWVNDRDVIRADVYAALPAVEAAARNRPTIRGMEDAIARANGGGDRRHERTISPDGRNYVFELRYPGEDRGPYLVVAFERGILDNLGREPWAGAVWEPNSRCLVDAYGPAALQTLRLYNTEALQSLEFGKVFAEQFECSGAYILYLTMEKPAAPPAGFPADTLVPVLMAYEPVEKPYFRVLEPDMNARRDGAFGPEVKMVPAPGFDKLADTVRDSLLYYTYVGAYAPCWPANAPPGPSPWP